MSAFLTFHIHHGDNRKGLLGNDVDRRSCEVIQIDILGTDGDALLFRERQGDLFPIFLTGNVSIAARSGEALNQAAASGAGSVDCIDLHERGIAVTGVGVSLHLHGDFT